MRNKSPEIRVTCQLCGSSYQAGHGVWTGQTIAKYQLSVCNTCYAANWDGWAPGWEEKFIAHLQARGIPVPPRNEKGWFPRE